jgi:hypothetical protein
MPFHCPAALLNFQIDSLSLSTKLSLSGRSLPSACLHAKKTVQSVDEGRERLRTLCKVSYAPMKTLSNVSRGEFCAANDVAMKTTRQSTQKGFESSARYFQSLWLHCQDLCFPVTLTDPLSSKSKWQRRSRTTMENIAVLAPMLNASISTAVATKPRKLQQMAHRNLQIVIRDDAKNGGSQPNSWPSARA